MRVRASASRAACAGAVAVLLCVTGALAQQPSNQSVSISMPGEWQVVQRDKEQMGTVPVEGTSTVAGDRVEARLVLMPGASGRETSWQKLNAAALPGKFSGQLRAPAGGWYELQVRVMRGTDATGEAKLAHVGVGEIFVIAGQSNAANYGGDGNTGIQKAEEERAVAYGKGKWQPASDPMPGASGSGGSCWCPFADMMVRSLDVPVGIASVAVGGSPMSSWLPDGGNYALLAQTLRSFAPGGVRAVLWHQGEADNGKTSVDVYYNGMKRIIEASSRDAGYPVQWFVAHASYIPVRYKPASVVSKAVREAQERLWKDKIAMQGPDTDDMVGPKYRCSDDIHMNRYGLITHGERWFAMVWGQVFAGQALPRAQAVVSGVIPEAEAAGAAAHSGK